MTNRYYTDTFHAVLGSIIKSDAENKQFLLVEQAFDLLQDDVDGLLASTVITGLQGFPASFAGAGLKLLRVNAAESAIEFASVGRLNIKSIGGTSYTLIPEDAGALLIFSNASPITVTVNSGVLEAGDVVCVRQGNAGQVTISAGAGVTFASSDGRVKTRMQSAQIALISDDGAGAYGIIGERDFPGVASLSSANVFTAGQAVTPVTLTDAATINTDGALSNTFIVTIAATGRTLANPTNLVDGQIYNWFVVQGSGGSKTITGFGDKFYWAGGSSPASSWSTAAGKIDLVVGQYLASQNVIWSNFLKGSA